MDRWDELRTAYWVARLGTVTDAAAHLGVHRATVVRHIDALEEALGGKLFQRHARGYEPTEAGHDVVRVARAAAEQFEQLAGRTRGRANEVSGELVVTATELMGMLIVPALAAFRVAHPDCTVQVIASQRVFQLAFGEAHVAVRLGARPDHPDNVVASLGPLRSGLYAHRSYVAQHGCPEHPGAYDRHAFVSDGADGLLSGWLAALAPDAPVVWSSDNGRLRTAAIAAGVGIGFHPVALADADPDLVAVHPPLEAWDVPIWGVTHVDLHRSAKVQAVLQALRAGASAWAGADG